jgi:phosphoribosylamine---glycine ligase
MRRILIVGSGGREHALAKCFYKSVTVEKVFVAPGNAGMGDVATIVPIEAMDFDKLINFSKNETLIWYLSDRKHRFRPELPMR